MLLVGWTRVWEWSGDSELHLGCSERVLGKRGRFPKYVGIGRWRNGLIGCRRNGSCAVLRCCVAVVMM